MINVDSCLSKVFHDISNSVSTLNFYVELLKNGDTSFSMEELDEINNSILIQLNILKFAFQEEFCPKICEYLYAYVSRQNKKLFIKNIDSKYTRFVVNLILHVINIFSRNGSIEVEATEDVFSFTITGNIRTSATEFIESLNSKKDSLSATCYIADFLVLNSYRIVGAFTQDTKFEIKLIKVE